MRQNPVGQSGVSGDGALARSERDVGQYLFPWEAIFFPMGLLEGPVEGPDIAFLRWRETVRGWCFFNRAKASGFVVLFGLWPSDILVLILFDEDGYLGLVDGCKKNEVE